MPVTFTTSDYNTVTVASQQMAAMIPGFQYRFISDTDCYVKIGLTGATTASAADDSHLVFAGNPLFVAARGTVAFLAVIRKSVDGVCTLSRMEPGQQ